MSWMIDRYQALRSLLRRGHLEDEVAEELEFHLAMRAEEYVAQGMTPEEARAEALRRFGSMDAYRKQTHQIDEDMARERRRTEIWDMVRRETRQALRSLARSPSFAVVAVLTLALGLGATTALYSVVDAVVLRPLPYDAPEQLVWLDSAVPGVAPDARWGLSEAGYLHFAREARGLASVGAFEVDNGSFATSDGALRVDVATVTASVMDVLRARPALGSLITPETDTPDARRVAVLGYDFWVRQYGADSRVLGTSVRLDDEPTEIIGVMARGLELPDDTVDVWMPLRLDPASRPVNVHGLSAIGRLKDGTSLGQAQAEITAMSARFPELFPSAYGESFMRETGFNTWVTPLAKHVVGDVDRVLWILLGSVALVLLIACANVANLFLVRSEARRRELAVRSALGAARGDLAWHALTESLLLCLVAYGLGLLLAHGALRLLVTLEPSGLPRLEEVGLGWHGAVVAAVLCVMAGVVFGLFPLARTGADVAALRESGRGLSASRRRNLMRGGMVVGQVGLAVVLLAAAGLMLRSYWTLHAVDPGLKPENVLTFDIVLPRTRYTNYDEVNRFHRELVSRLEALPGVTGVGAGSRLPLRDFGGCAGLSAEGVTPKGGLPPCLPVVGTAPGYFRALGIPLLQGRELTWEDLDRKADGVVVTKALAERMWPGEDALGKGIRGQGNGPPYYHVIGVAGDLRAHGLDKPPAEAVFFPLAPAAKDLPLWGPRRAVSVAVRTATTRPESLTPDVRRILSELDATVPLANVQTMERAVAKSPSVARATFTLFLLGIAGSMALLLSAVGLYGVIAFIVGQRRGEMGIRMALGARAAQVAGMVVLQSLRFTTLGIVLGLVGALAMGQVMSALLFEVSASDPLVLAAVCGVLVMLAMLAAYGPARRAARVDPAEVLRSE
ncbi:ABC transporter permease [Pyxidicoccus parkwayensis]|uniref:ABC transporter permease n=1 Tax=Pyxidicoccus parkwayensis TaxID=2813578 RepID=A0ABX7NVI3_9BACT|nr:ABC transporter permease [Pyxidicoccus parkwaysis]QSQ21409.1 ABC transporter permease [Pyxidicoccus parkwaysis]